MILSGTTTYKQLSCRFQILFQLYQALVAYQKYWNVKPSAICSAGRESDMLLLLWIE